MSLVHGPTTKSRTALWRIAATFAVLCLPPPLLNILARIVLGDTPVWPEVAAAYAFALVVAMLAGYTGPYIKGRAWQWSLLTPLSGLLGLGLLLLPAARESTLFSWLAVGSLWLAALHLGLSLKGARGWRVLRTLLLLAGLTAFAGFVPVAVLQWHERFSTEEAFALLQAAVLAGVFLLLLPPASLVAGYSSPAVRLPSFSLRRRWAGSVAVALLAAVAICTLFLYQGSFYDPTPPDYPGITEQTPFNCLPAQLSDQVYDGQEVFARLVANIETKPNKDTPGLGMLALSTGKAQWAQAFRDALLEEARTGKFTEPSNSVKYPQYEAALRAYYLPRIERAFPALFDDAEERELADWFAAINRRALTVEWSDWVYAAALGNRPTGLYENQENGAGLVSNLIAGDLQDPGLATANRAYLEDNVRGWAARFRNTDDAFIYQPEWIDNALFQSLAGQPIDPSRKALSFEWLLLQAQPDGELPPYNHPSRPSLAGVAYLGASELGDPRYMWLAGRALDEADAHGRFVSAPPGVETPLALRGTAPEQGSCLLYGDSGLPTRSGPLAPDKIVMRSGWDAGAAYVLLNLRFTGWHRYKATNTISLVSFGQQVVGDQPGSATFAWLPKGRSLFRDKRIPREGLNGVLFEARGLEVVARALTGIGSYWAQDPPWHARVLEFNQEGAWDVAQAVIDDWHGWQQTRTVYLHRNGNIVVVADESIGPANGQAGLAWHLQGDAWTNDPAPAVSLRTGEGSEARRVVLLSDSGTPTPSYQLASGAENTETVLYISPTQGKLKALTVFLSGAAANADVRVEQDAGGNRLAFKAPRFIDESLLLVPSR